MKGAATTIIHRICSIVVPAAGGVILLSTPAVAREEVHPVARGFAEIECPAAPGAIGPFFHTADNGTVTLSWVEPSGDGHRLRFATWENDAWSEARTVAEGTDWFVNWADVPSVVAGAGGRMAAHWLEKSGEDTYAYDVRVSQSFDGGESWGTPVTPHDDGTQTEHGFASLVFHGGFLHIVWLDGRKFADEGTPQEMTLRAARIDREGVVSGGALLDERCCDCCPTDVAAVDGGFIVAYRDRSPDEIRDISVVRYVNGGWEQPRPVHNDGWKIAGCPVNGPALASSETGVAVAWFTMEDDRSRVRAAWSSDAGRTFSGVVAITDEEPLGRVAMSGGRGYATVAWLAVSSDGARIESRRMSDGLLPGKVRTLAYTSAARSSGYPRVVLLPDGRLLAAWTAGGVRTGVLEPAREHEEQRPQ